MRIASLHNVTTHYGAQPVLTGASFEINSGQKLGLIGTNGSGKTTILKVLTGREPVTGGSVYLDPGARVGYVPQHFEHDTDSTVIDWLLRDYRPIADALHDQEDALARSSAADMDGALRAYQRARDAYDRIDGDSWPRRAQALLDAFGLGGKERQRVTSLSGGEKNVLSLAQALLSEPDLLLLDEPANHLDYLGVAWLEDFLVKFGGTVLIVSHNRYLLDRVVGGILELEGGRIQAVQRRLLRLPRRKAAPAHLAAAGLRRQPEASRPAGGPGEALRADCQVESRSRMGKTTPGAQVTAGAGEETGRRKAGTEPEGRECQLHDRGDPVRHRPPGARIQQGLRRPAALRRCRPAHF